MTIAEAISYGTAVLRDNEVVEARRESTLLLSLAIRKERAFLIAHPEDILEEAHVENFRRFIERRARHEPFQYISGRQEFCGLEFEVGPNVLIPRPETEGLVEAAITKLAGKAAPLFCEVGVGSGCISISLLHSVRNALAVAVDVSSEAIATARRNAEKHGVADRLELLVSDVFRSIGPERFDLVVSNPPYVPSQEIAALQPEVRDFEPRSALTDGADGLSIIRRLISDAPAHMKPKAGIIIEIGFNQSAEVVKMFDPAIWGRVEMLPDLQGIPRIARARLR